MLHFLVSALVALAAYYPHLAVLAVAALMLGVLSGVARPRAVPVYVRPNGGVVEYVVRKDRG